MLRPADKALQNLMACHCYNTLRWSGDLSRHCNDLLNNPVFQFDATTLGADKIGNTWG